MVKSGHAVLWVLLLAGCAVSNPIADSSPASAPQSSPDGAVTTPVPTTPAVSPITPESAAVGDLQMIPGDRFGPITAATTYEDLVQRFGEAQLTNQAIAVGEGESEPGTVVNLGASESFTVVWKDDTRSKIDHIRNPGSAWKTPEGIGIGTTFGTLQQKLGDFQLYGFAWDYGGTVDLENSNLDAYKGLLILRVQPSQAAVETAKPQFEEVLGDTLYPSTNPNFQALDLKVEEMLIFLEPRSQ